MSKVSEKYRKYLVKITIDRMDFYCIWGTDISGDDEKDFVLTNSKNKIILFRKLLGFKSRVQKYKKSFIDKENFISWISENTFSRSYSKVDIDILNILSVSRLEFILKHREQSLKLIDSINFITDFAQQTNNKKLLDKLKDKNVDKVWDLIYNQFFWKTKQKKTPEFIKKVVRNDLDLTHFALIHDYFSECVVVDGV